MEITSSELVELFGATHQPEYDQPDYDHWIGRYVIVRCRDAGVHAGELVSMSDRSCELRNARRLWYWKPNSGAFLSAVSATGLNSESKIGTPIDIILTENCEIMSTSAEAKKSIVEAPDYEPV